MKKSIAMVMMLALAAVLGLAGGAAGGSPPKLVYEPVGSLRGDVSRIGDEFRQYRPQ